MPDAIFPRVIDATMRSNWRACPHSFFRRHVQGLTKAGGVSVHLHFGACIARGLEVARKAYCGGASSQNALLDGCEALIAAWGNFEAAPRTRTEANKTLEAALSALQAYLREWPLDDDPVQIHRHNNEPCVEFSFALPIPGSRHPDTGDPIIYCGRYDFIGDYQSAVWGVDDKTTSSDPNSDYWRQQWKLRGQFSGYCWGAREYGLPLKGFIVRGIGILTHDIRCSWALTPRPEWMVDQWLAQLKSDVWYMCEQYKHLRLRDIVQQVHPDDGADCAHPFPQSFADACADFGGCQFVDLCANEHPELWLDDYTINRWNPLERSDA